MRKFLAETRTDRNVSFSKIYISRDDCEVCTILGERGGEEASLIYHRAVSVDVKTPSRQTTFFPALYFRHVTRDICSERLEYWSTVPFLFSAISSRKFGKLKKKEIIYKDRGINSNASKIHWKKKKDIRLFHKRGDVFEILSSPLLSIKQLRAHGARDEKRLPVFRARVQQKKLYVPRVSSTVFIFYYDILVISSSGRNFYPQFIEKINDRNDDFERDRFSIRTNASLRYIFPSFRK